MSGPKGYGYSVVSAEELRRREDDSRAGRCRQHMTTLVDLAAELRQYGVPGWSEVSEPPELNHDSLIAWERELLQAIPKAQQAVEKAAAQAFVHSLNASRPAVDTSQISLGERRASASSADREDLRKEVERLTESLSRVRDRAARVGFAAQALGVLAARTPAEARGDLLTVKSAVARTLRAQEFAGLAENEVLAIAHLHSPEADAVRARATAVASADELADLQSVVAAIVEADMRAQDTAFVEAALADVLTELGFVVGDEFDLPELDRRVVLVDHREHPGYALRLQLNPTDHKLYSRVVAQVDSSAEQDAAVEAATCERVHAVASGLEKHGVATQLTFERQPGERPVDRQEVPENATPVRRMARRARTKKRGRSA